MNVPNFDAILQKALDIRNKVTTAIRLSKAGIEQDQEKDVPWDETRESSHHIITGKKKNF